MGDENPDDKAALVLGDSEIPFTDAKPLFTNLDLDSIAQHTLDNIDDPTMPVRFYSKDSSDPDDCIDVDLDFTTFRSLINHLSDRVGEWAGIPVPVDHTRIRVEERYPWKGIEGVGGPQPDPDDTPSSDDPPIFPLNTWYVPSRQARITLYREGTNPKTKFILEPKLSYVRRLDFWLNTMGCSSAWEPEAEIEAQKKLSSLIPSHLFNMYFMTGTFIETSPRSRVTYLFRRLRPTIAMVPAKRSGNPAQDSMKAIAVLCMHPIAYYEKSWSGAMCPTDDVVAHLLMMRGDERKYWALSNQHDPESPEAGI